LYIHTDDMEIRPLTHKEIMQEFNERMSRTDYKDLSFGDSDYPLTAEEENIIAEMRKYRVKTEPSIYENILSQEECSEVVKRKNRDFL